MSDHERIWLQHPLDADPNEGRMWCQHWIWPTDDEHPPTEYVRADLASQARAEGRREGLEEAAKAAEEVGNFGDYRRDELTKDYGQPKFDMMHNIIAAIRALAQKEGGKDG